ncbi:MAG: hypothetical protein HQK51_00945 [Oligoflexia bacterium]|nr:hypothetical protein [Oligoflexia bacterium]
MKKLFLLKNKSMIITTAISRSILRFCWIPAIAVLILLVPTFFTSKELTTIKIVSNASGVAYASSEIILKKPMDRPAESEQQVQQVQQTSQASTEISAPIDVKAEKLELLDRMISAFEDVNRSNLDKFKKDIYAEIKKITKEYNMGLKDLLQSSQISEKSRKKVLLAARLEGESKSTSTTTSTPSTKLVSTKVRQKEKVPVKKNWEEECSWYIHPISATSSYYEFTQDFIDFVKQAYNSEISSIQVRFENVSKGIIPGTFVGTRPYILREDKNGEMKKIFYGLEGTDPEEVIKRMGIIGEVLTDEKSKKKAKMVTPTNVGGFWSGETLVFVNDGKTEFKKDRKMIETITFRPFNIAEIKKKKRQEVAELLAQIIDTNDILRAKSLLEKLPEELSISKVDDEIQKIDQITEEQTKILMTKMDERQNLMEKFLMAWKNSNANTEVEKYKLLSLAIKKLLQNIQDSETKSDVLAFLKLSSVSKNIESGNNLLSSAILSGDKEMVEILMKKYPLMLTDDDLRFNRKNENARDLAKAALLKIKKEQPTNSAEIISRREIASILDEYYNKSHASIKLYFRDLKHIKDVSPLDLAKMQTLLEEIKSAIKDKKIDSTEEVEKMIADEDKLIKELLAAKELQEAREEEARQEALRNPVITMKTKNGAAIYTSALNYTIGGITYKNTWKNLDDRLVWLDTLQSNGIDIQLYPDDAINYCANLDKVEHKCRVPTDKEWYKLAFDLGYTNDGYDPQFIHHLTGRYFHSMATTTMHNPRDVIIFNGKNGHLGIDMRYFRHSVRCVCDL